MNIVINGEEREIDKVSILSELLQALDLPLARIAVELNQTVVRRADWEKTVVKDNDRLEIVHFVGGG